IGGDECPKIRWEKCPACQKRMKDEGLKDENELQSWFIQRIEKFLISKDRKIIGWDEILEGGLAPEATVMSWRGTQGGIAAAKQKHDVIMTPNRFVYLDYYQTEPAGEPLAIGGYLPLERVYSYNPMPEELTPDEQKHILGVQGNVWTEYISTPEHMEYMAFPRAFAIAETGWTPDRLKDFEEFLKRLEILSKRYDAIGINYFRGEYRDTRAERK
ncbi:beta-N-acetylhexosaminidase, partial [bacterium]